MFEHSDIGKKCMNAFMLLKKNKRGDINKKDT